MKTALLPSDDAPGEAAWRCLYPFASREMELSGVRCHYVDEGPLETRPSHGDSTGAGTGDATGETLLLSHGNPTWSFHWRALILAQRDRCRVVAPDHLGCGWSDGADRAFRLADRIDHLVELIERLDLHDITLVAHDWGGAIGLGAALALPDRFARFVLLNTGAYPPWFIPWRIRVCRTPGLGRLAVQGGNLFLLAALRMALARPEKFTRAVRAGYLAPYGGWRNRGAIYQFVEDIPWSRKHVTHETLSRIERDLPSLADRPFQLIWGMQDWCFTPACLERFVEILPQAEVCRLEAAGHWVLEDATSEVLETIEQFLNRHPIGNGKTTNEDE